uniref:Pyrin domain-containing protein n=1 Tax=Mastacembelus armatus TaxID=205130 RepID=A0A3Q3LGW2_9TELE
MLAQELLLESLENLRKDDFEKFKWYLSMKVLPDCKPIPESHLEDAERTKTVTVMIKSYGEDGAVSLTIETLKKIQNNNACDHRPNSHWQHLWIMEYNYQQIMIS